ncbi:MAG: ABC transporter permease [Treponema sp.]|nr:ABC transporter permease [Treponema sp.]
MSGKGKPLTGKASESPAQSPQLKAAKAAGDAKYRKSNPGPAYAWPMGLWFTIFFVVPLFIIVLYSFMKRDVYGGVVHEFTLKAYRQMFDKAYGMIFLRTLWITVISTAITILIALPCGYAMARSRHQTLLLILVVVPFLTNSLIRIFAWITILGDNGILNSMLGFFFNLFHKGKTFVPHKFMFTQGAVILVSIYMYLPYAILPIFTAVDRFDFSLLEAARDLGATKPQSMVKVLIPGIKSGVLSALIFTFIPIFGAYTVPQLVGGKDSYMLGNIIVDQVQKVRNWPLASAFSMVITAVSMIAILWMLSSNKKEDSLRKVSNKEELQTSPSIATAIHKEGLK